MKKNCFIYSFLILLLTLTNIFAQKKEVVAYFPEWGGWGKPFRLKNLVDNKSIENLTVINYAFSEPKMGLDGKVYPSLMDTNKAYAEVYTADISIDGVADSENQPLRGFYNQILKLKKKYPNLKVVISLGGWAGSTYFSDAALTEETRNDFVDKCINLFIKGNLPKYGNAGGEGVAKGVFDGIDIDWEYPVEGGNTGIRNHPDDGHNMTKLLKLFREKLDAIDKKLLLTVAYPGTEKLLDNFNVNLDQNYLNWFCLMTYDYRGDWDSTSGHHTNILKGNNVENSMDNTVKLFLNKYKVHPSKIVVGAAFYGRGWKVESEDNYGLHQVGTAPKRDPNSEGFRYFHQIVPNSLTNYKLYWDNSSLAPYAFNKEKMEFYTFDDEQSVTLKAQYMDAYNLRGIMFWEITGDVNSILTNAIKNRSTMKPEFVKPTITIQLDKDAYIKGDNIVVNSILSENFEPLYVEFYSNKKLIGRDTKAPFNWAIFNAKKGNNTIKLIAYDKYGNKYESKSAQVNIK